MDRITELANELKKELDNLPLFQEYKRVKSLVESSNEIEDLKKQIALAKLHNENDKHKALLKQYNSHPLIVNLNALENEVCDYLKQISEIVNKKWCNFTSFFL